MVGRSPSKIFERIATFIPIASMDELQVCNTVVQPNFKCVAKRSAVGYEFMTMSYDKIGP